MHRRTLGLWLAAALSVGGVLVVPGATAMVSALPAINEPPLTGQIISFPQRDFVSTPDSWNFPFVDVEVLRPDLLNAANLIRVGYAKDVVPQPGGIVEVNHPGGACWGPVTPGNPSSAVTPDISPGDRIRLTALDANHLPVAVDQTTTADVLITQTSTQTGPGIVELRGTAVQQNGVTPIPAAQLEVRLIASSKDRFDVGNKRDIRAPGTAGSTFTIDATGHWAATFSGLTAHDLGLALTVENRVIWLGNTPNESTIYEVGSLVAPGPAAPCTAPLAAAQVSSDRPSIVFLATQVGQTSAAERIRLTNIGVGSFSNLTTSSVTVTGGDAASFPISTNQCTGVVVPIGGHCDLFVSFAPTTAGLKGAAVQIVTNAGALSIPVTATAFAADPGTQVPVGLVQPPQIDFGTRAVGNSTPTASVILTNIGSASMNVSPP